MYRYGIRQRSIGLRQTYENHIAVIDKEASSGLCKIIMNVECMLINKKSSINM